MRENQPKNEIEILEHSIYNVMWAEQKKGEKLLKEHHLSLPQFLVLVSLIRRGGECPIGEIAEELFQSNPTMTGIVDRLVNAHLVAREHGHPDDRRKVLVSLTPQGKHLLHRARQARRERMRLALNRFSGHDRKEFLRLLMAYLNALGEEAELK